MDKQHFVADHTYENVYLMFVDASGHSSIVSSNPRDRADQAFNLVQQRILDRLQAIQGSARCDYAEPWGWQGDGGLLIIHDSNESTARDVAINTGQTLLKLDLRHLQDEFNQQGLRGELHLRIGLHKGTIKYLGYDRRGSIHSPDINFAAHLEKAAPRDTLAISEDVHRVCGEYASEFELGGMFEERKIYLWAPGGSSTVARSWLNQHGLAGGVQVFGFHERPSQAEKARMVASAINDIIDLGTALNTCSNYLVTTERPATYRDAVLHFLNRGGKYRCYLMDPTAEATREIEKERQENLATKIEQSIEKFDRFKRRHGDSASELQVYSSNHYPGMAALAMDLDGKDGNLLISPYIHIPVTSSQYERGDMPHYLITRNQPELYEVLRQTINILASDQHTERLL